MKNLKLYGFFLWIGFNYLKAAEPLPRDSLFFTTQSPEVSGTHLINFSEMKGWKNLDLEASKQIWIQDPGLHLNH